MAQATVGFPWHNRHHDQIPALSEKATNSSRNDTRGSELTDTTNSTQHAQSQINRVPTDKHKHMSISKSRKRAGSVKPQAPYIPQTREELDTHLAYAPTRHFNVRTIPAWVRDAEEDDIVDDNEDVLDTPHTALVAQHNSNPSTTVRTGRQERHVMSSGATRSDKTSRWITFARSSAYPRENFNSEKVDVEWLNENFTDYSRPWLQGHGDDSELDNKYRGFQRKRAGWYKRAQFVILRNPFIPLAFRFTVIVFAAIAIALGGSILHDSKDIRTCAAEPEGSRDQRCFALFGNEPIEYYQDPSGLMAVIVDAIAIVYTIFVTYDEYFSKPLGLRPARAKIRLVLVDLFFIVFQSANLSLAFESLTVGDGACQIGSSPGTSWKFDSICNKAKGLSSVLLVSLFAWLLTFSVSVLRLVERINVR